jgi:hypothetical protein
MGASLNRPNFYQYDCSKLLKWAQGLYIGAQPKLRPIPHGDLRGKNLAPKLWA